MRFSRRLERLPGSRIRAIVAEISKLKREGLGVYEFHVGQPGLPPSLEMIEEFAETLRSRPFDLSSYTPAAGLEEVRQAVAEDYSNDSGVSIDVNNVCMTTGSSESIAAAFMAILEPGDEVVIRDPEYMLYSHLASYFDAKVVRVPVSVEREFNPDVETLKSLISRRTKIVVLVSPDNPTGSTLSEEVVKCVVDLAKDYDIYVIYDEAYRSLYYDGSHIYAVRYDLDHVIALNTLSKDAALPGWRIGYVVSHEDVIKSLVRVKQYINLNPPTPAQHMAYLFVTKYKRKYLQSVIPVYRERRDAMYEAILKYIPEAKTFKPKAGLFMFPNVRSYLRRIGLDDEEFSTKLLREAGVAVVPGSAFGEHGRDHIRLCFAKESRDRIVDGVRRISEFIERYEAGREGLKRSARP